MESGMRIFKRKIYESMLKWKQERDGKTALLIKGARRVGKSTIAEEFARNEYESYIVVDFADAPDELWEAVEPDFITFPCHMMAPTVLQGF